MELTKLEHAALLLEIGSHKLFVDPGNFTSPLTETVGTVAVVITHEHPDHWTPEQLDRVIEMNDNVKIFAPAGVAAAASGYDITVVTDGDVIEVEPFTLRFFGTKHAVIHPSIPVVDNVGVLINDTLYYPGDSFTIPAGVEVGTLAAPAGAPWLKISEAMDFVTAIAPKRAFPTHDIVLSRVGKDLADTRLKSVTEAAGGEYHPLQPNEKLSL